MCALLAAGCSDHASTYVTEPSAPLLLLPLVFAALLVVHYTLLLFKVSSYVKLLTAVHPDAVSAMQ